MRLGMPGGQTRNQPAQLSFFAAESAPLVGYFPLPDKSLTRSNTGGHTPGRKLSLLIVGSVNFGTMKQLSSPDLVFRAFSDPTRLRILCLLRQSELCVGDLVSILKVPQPTASRHLAYLRKAGLVMPRDHGSWTFYGLAPASTAFHEKLLECLAHCFTEISKLKTDAARAQKLARTGGCCPQ